MSTALSSDVQCKRSDVGAWVEGLAAKGAIERIEFSRILPHGEREFGGMIGGDAAPQEIATHLETAMQFDADRFFGEQRYLAHGFLRTETGKPADKFSAQAEWGFLGKGERATAEDPTKTVEFGIAGYATKFGIAMGEQALAHGKERDRSKERIIELLMQQVVALSNGIASARDREIAAHQAQMRDTVALTAARQSERIQEFGYNFLSLAAPVVMSKMLPAGTIGGTTVRGEDKVKDFFLDLSPNQTNAIATKCGLNPIQIGALKGVQDAFLAGKSPNFGDETLGRLLTTLTPAQLQAIAGVLRPEQLLALDEIAGTFGFRNGKVEGAGNGTNEAIQQDPARTEPDAQK